MAILKKEYPSNIDFNTPKWLEDIVAKYNSCHRMAKKPFVFQVTMPGKIIFSQEIFLDLAWLESRPHPPILNIADRGTHFSPARFVPNESAEGIWNAFGSCWISICAEFPKILSHDQASIFNSEFSLPHASNLESNRSLPRQSHITHWELVNNIMHHFLKSTRKSALITPTSTRMLH